MFRVRSLALGILLCACSAGQLFAQTIRIDAETSFAFPDEIAGCPALAIDAGAGIVSGKADCPSVEPGSATRAVEITVVSGGGHLHSSTERLTQIITDLGHDRSELAKFSETFHLPTLGRTLALTCVRIDVPEGGTEMTCVREEPLTRIEIRVTATTAEQAAILLKTVVSRSALK